MEAFPTFLIVMNACAITFPRFAAAAGFVWAFGRIWYQIGYGKHGPAGRSKGSIFAGVAQLTLVNTLLTLSPTFFPVYLFGGSGCWSL